MLRFFSVLFIVYRYR